MIRLLQMSLPKLCDSVSHYTTGQAQWLRLLCNSVLVREFGWLALSTGLLQFANLLLNLSLARVLGPSAFGEWNALILFVSYLSFLQLGVINGMNRDVPLYTGAGDFKRVKSIQETALSGVLIASLTGMAILWAIPSGWLPDVNSLLAMRITATYLVALQLYSYVGIYLNSKKQFNLFSLQQGVLGVVLLLVVLPASIIGGLEGAMVAYAAAYGVATLIVTSRANIQFTVELSFARWFDLVRVGFPIMLVGICYLVLTSLDRWVILSSMGSQALGYYSLPARILSLSLVLTGLVAQQTYPRVAEVYGRTRSVNALIPYLRQQVLATLGITLVANLGLLVSVPALINWLLPQYTSSLSLVPILLLAMSLLPQTGVFGVFLNILDMQVPYLAIQVLAIALGFAFTVTAASGGWGLEGVAVAVTIAYAVYLALLVGLTAMIIHRHAAALHVPLMGPD